MGRVPVDIASARAVHANGYLEFSRKAGYGMPEHRLTETFSNRGTRNEVRMRVVNRMSEEISGQGKGELASRYVYFVETLDDGRRVYLKRPSNLHRGFDFAIYVEDTDFMPDGKRRERPSHGDIISDLSAKRDESRAEYDRLFAQMEQVYLCNDIDYAEASSLTFTVGYPCDLVLKVLKWFFIEQDIRYWNYSGRGMLWSAILSI